MKTQNTFLLTIIFLTGFFILTLNSCRDDDEGIINENLPEITTNDVTEIYRTKAVSGGKITHDGGSFVISRGVIWDKSVDPTVNDSDGMTNDGDGPGSFISNISGLEPDTEYYLRAYATNKNGTGYGNVLSFTTTSLPEPDFGEGATDIDGNEYVTVIIGDQEWMAENLRVTRYNNGDDIPTGLSNAEWENATSGAYATSISVYGNVYNWYTVDDSRGLCPEGWSVPSDDDWKQLLDYVVAQGFPNEDDPLGAGNALKSCRQVGSPLDGCDTSEHPRWDSDETNYGFDEFGFSALPGGARFWRGSFSEIGKSGIWWTSTETSSRYAWHWVMRDWWSEIYHSSGYSKPNGYSVRCIKD